MLDIISQLTGVHPLVMTDEPYSIFHTVLSFCVQWLPWPWSSIMEVMLGMMYEAEDRMGLVGDDREVEGETNGLPDFDNTESLDYLEEHEKINGRYVHQEYDPEVIKRKAAIKAKKEAYAKKIADRIKKGEEAQKAAKDAADWEAIRK
tara:strand:+ start:81 stop:524 length:444 start_codon:yes stop_codon:yes gene_type:complete